MTPVYVSKHVTDPWCILRWQKLGALRSCWVWQGETNHQTSQSHRHGNYGTLSSVCFNHITNYCVLFYNKTALKPHWGFDSWIKPAHIPQQFGIMPIVIAWRFLINPLHFVNCQQMRTKMSATITVCILLLAKTLLDEGCELSTTFCFASCNLLTVGCI